MAAADDEEGQSENKKDDSLPNARANQFSTMQQDFEAKLTRCDCTYENRVGIILSGWERLTGAISDSHLSFATFLYKWTLQLILQGEWPKLENIVKTRLGATLQRCTRDPLLKEMTRKLHPLVTDPWGNPILNTIITEGKASEENIKQYIREDSWEVIRVRVDTMVQSKCEKLASCLLNSCLSCLPPKDFVGDCGVPKLPESDRQHLFDLNLVLMHKVSKKIFLDMVKKLEPEEGVAFVQRLLQKDEKNKLWKHKLKISSLATQMFLAASIVKTFDPTYRLVFTEWCTVMKANNEASELLTEMVRKYIQLAESSQHIYTMGSVLYQMWKKKHTALVTELLIRALTLDMNDVERIKSKYDECNLNNKEHVKYEHQMALGFMDLASLFNEHKNVARECVLTAFSLHPTEERLQSLECFALGDDVKQEEAPSQTEEPVSMDEFVAKTEGLINQLHSGEKASCHADILTAPQEVLDAESLGLSKELCDDLAVVVSSPRWQVLSWMLKPKELLSICQRYFHDSDSAKNLTKELKYLNIDYNQFRHLPSIDVDEFTGIEKGYEHFMEDSDLDDTMDDSTTVTQYSSTSEAETSPCGSDKSKKRKFKDSSVHDSKTYKSKCASSESDENDVDYVSHLSTYKKGFEGKRVTSVSYGDTRKRLKLDPDTGQLTSSKFKINALRLYRHANANQIVNCSSKTSKSSDPSSINVLKSNQSPLSPALGSLSTKDNLYKQYIATLEKMKNSPHLSIQYPRNPSCCKVRPQNPTCSINPVHSVSPRPITVTYASGAPLTTPPVPVSTAPHTSLLRAHLEGLVDNNSGNSKVAPTNSTCQSTINTGNASWKYSGYVVASKTTNPLQSCVYKTKDGRIVHVRKDPIGSSWSKASQSPLSEQIRQNYQTVYKQHSQERNVLKNVQPHIFRNRSNLELAIAQKNVLNTIMSPEHRKDLGVGQLGETIAMPVSHTPPNVPAIEKSAAGLNRVLPKGTTVVRKPKSESGAGPSGISRNPSMSVISHGASSSNRNEVSITPRVVNSDNFFLESHSARARPTRVVTHGMLTDTGNHDIAQLRARSSPLASATVAESISTVSPLRLANPPEEIPGGTSSFTLTSSRLSPVMPSTTTAVACVGGESRGTSMLESLLRERPSSISNIVLSGTTAPTATTSALHEPLVASSTAASNSPHILSSSSGSQTSVMTSISGSVLNRIACDSRSVAVGADSLGTLHHSSGANNNALSVMLSGSSSSTTNTASRSIGVGNSSAVSVISGNASSGSGMHQLVLPAQLIQVQGTDGSTGLGIVHSGSLDLRLPPGTRVIKSSATSQSTTISGSQPQVSRQVNLLHNLKIVHQNRPVVRTVVVPPSSGIPNLTHSSTQLVNLSSAQHVEVEASGTVTKMQHSHLQKLLGHNVVPGGLVIRAVRPSINNTETIRDPSMAVRPQALREPSDQKEIKVEDNVESYKPRTIPYSSHCEGLGERLSRHFMKTSHVPSTSTQSVGTQTQTTAVKPVTGQIVSQVLMNPLQATSSTTAMNNLPVVSHVGSASSTEIPQALNLTASNSVSSETLEQLREFESVFEKVSNKSGKETPIDICPQNFPNTSVSSEESMIAAQLLSMANDTPLSSSSTYICSMPSKTPEVAVVSTASSPVVAAISGSVANVTPQHLAEGTLINTQTGTLILVNPSTVSNPVQPPPPDSPGLSSTSSHSSVASSPSSTSSKSKKQVNKTKIVQTTASGPPKPKSPPPPPPKVPTKPAVAKPQVEESDEIKARIQSILDQYKQDLANTPQPQPAPRNRKNCPPPKTEGKSSNKKKSHIKKSEGTSTTSPSSTEGGLMPSVSSSPVALSTPTGEESDGSGVGSSSSNRFANILEEKGQNQDNPSPPVIQGVVVPNVKVDGTANVGTLTNVPQAISGNRVYQLVRHGNKVAAIPAQQHYKLKSGSGPPNVTIQGRISVSDLMEGQLTSLISGASGSTVNANSSLIAKLLQPQQSGIQQIFFQSARQSGEQHGVSQATVPLEVQSPSKFTQGENRSLEDEENPEPTQQLTNRSPSAITSSPQSLNSGSSPFHNIPEDTSNSSDHSQDDVGRLPPFFTLTKPFVEPATNKPTDKSNSNKVANLRTSKNKSPSNESTAGTSTFIVTDLHYNDERSSNVDDSSQEALLEMTATVATTTASSSTSLTPTTSAQTNNSIESMRSDIGTEEVQIPPSPATLTKQLQNAYMTDAALSPAISQSQLSSSSSYSSPATVQDLQFLDANGESPQYSPALNQRYSSAGPSGHVISTSSSNGLSNATLACLASPSGDVYLDQAGVGLGLESLPLGEEHAQSPSLSDLVPAVPLLSWSPRSADSLMEQSPAFNENIVGGMNLEPQHSEDSLCDSSTGFPVLFSIEPDAASISSNVSEEMNLLRTGNASFVSSGVTSNSTLLRSSVPSGNSLQGREQDQTVSSTRAEAPSSSPQSMPVIEPHSTDSKDGDTTDSDSFSWRFNTGSFLDRNPPVHTYHRRRQSSRNKQSKTCSKHEGEARSENFGDKEEIKSEENPVLAHNGLLDKLKMEDSSRHTRSRRSLPTNCSEPKPKDMNDKIKKDEVKCEDGGESSQRQTRGSKRRSDACRSVKLPKADVKTEDEDKSSEEAEASSFRKLRARHVSGTSDSSSNFSMDCVSTPGTQDSPNANGGFGGKRKRRLSNESSTSSRDGSPLSSTQSSQDAGGSMPAVVNTRRSSSREQSKKTRCACCVDQTQVSLTHNTPNNRRTSRSARGTPTG